MKNLSFRDWVPGSSRRGSIRENFNFTHVLPNYWLGIGTMV